MSQKRDMGHPGAQDFGMSGLIGTDSLLEEFVGGVGGDFEGEAEG